jgi:hypothetical protein
MSRVSRPGSQDRRNDVVSLKLAREGLGRPRGRSNGTVPKRPGRSAWNSEATDKRLAGWNLSKQRLRERLETENAELRHRVAALALQIQALRDGP